MLDPTFGWPRTGAMCAPVQQCCCKGPWTIGPGEIQPLVMDWSEWILSVQGYNLHNVASASLWDVNNNPPVPANPDIIKVISGIDGDDTPSDNSDLTYLIDLIPPYAAQMLISVSPEARIGSQYKLDICMEACDGCNGRRIRQCDCVVITIAEC